MTHSGPRSFALWLLPAPGALGPLGAYITDVGFLLGVPPYMPHVTVYAGETADLDAAARALPGLPAPPGPLDLPLRGVGGEAAWSRALYLAFARVDALVTLSGAAQAALGGGAPYALDPHLSLTYRADLTDLERAELDEARPPLPRVVRFDRLAIAAPGPKGWPDIASWRPLGVRAL